MKIYLMVDQERYIKMNHDMVMMKKDNLDVIYE
jgi:hypothetical protein